MQVELSKADISIIAKALDSAVTGETWPIQQKALFEQVSELSKEFDDLNV